MFLMLKYALLSATVMMVETLGHTVTAFLEQSVMNLLL